MRHSRPVLDPAPVRRRLRRWTLCLGHGALTVLLAAGCAKARAETVPDGPPLATPAPPPRVLVPVEEVLAEAPPPPELPAEVEPEPAAAPPPPRRPAADTTQKPPDPPSPAVAAPAVETPVRTPSPNPVEEKKIADVLARASQDLSKVNYQGLNGDGRAQYDDSKRFAELATGAVKDRNYTMASTLADKAATIAAQLLAGR